VSNKRPTYSLCAVAITVACIAGVWIGSSIRPATTYWGMGDPGMHEATTLNGDPAFCLPPWTVIDAATGELVFGAAVDPTYGKGTL
jgi:hypothetical protein